MLPSPVSETRIDEPMRLGYPVYVLFVLMVCYTLAFVDRQILSLLVAPIKAGSRHQRYARMASACCSLWR